LQRSDLFTMHKPKGKKGVPLLLEQHTHTPKTVVFIMQLICPQGVGPDWYMTTSRHSGGPLWYSQFQYITLHADLASIISEQ